MRGGPPTARTAAIKLSKLEAADRYYISGVKRYLANSSPRTKGRNQKVHAHL